MRLRIFNRKLYFRFFVWAGLLLLFVACNKGGREFRSGEIRPPSVTGYIERNEVGDIIRIVGRPNVNLGDANDYRDATYYLNVYPNPSKSKKHTLEFKAPAGTVKRYWIVPANQTPDVHQLGANMAFIGGAPIWTLETTTEILQVDLRAFPGGLYRVYAEVGNQLFYDNLLLL